VLLATVILAYLMVECALLVIMGRCGRVDPRSVRIHLTRHQREWTAHFVSVAEELELSLPTMLLQDDPSERFKAFIFKHKNVDGGVTMKFSRT